MNFEIKSLEDAELSDQFVAAHAKGSVFHSRAMCRALQEPRENEVCALVAIDEPGRIRALLAAVRVSTVGGIARRFASRSIMYAEPICTPDPVGEEALSALLQHHDDYMASRALFAEIRPLFPSQGEQTTMEMAGYQRMGYQNYELRLDKTIEQLWQQLGKKCRSDIKRSRKKGLVIREGKLESSDLDLLYSHLQSSYSRSRIPLADKSLFEATSSELGADQIRLTFAEYEGRSVAAVCHLVFGDRIIYWYGGVERTKGVAANTCLLWDSIEWASTTGKSIFDFGGAGWEGEDYGPGKFKAQFGGDLVSYGRYRRIYAKRLMRFAEGSYQLMRRFLAPRGNAA